MFSNKKSYYNPNTPYTNCKSIWINFLKNITFNNLQHLQNTIPIALITYPYPFKSLYKRDSKIDQHLVRYFVNYVECLSSPPSFLCS